jgi:hypothetical protein
MIRLEHVSGPSSGPSVMDQYRRRLGGLLDSSKDVIGGTAARRSKSSWATCPRLAGAGCLMRPAMPADKGDYV